MRRVIEKLVHLLTAGKIGRFNHVFEAASVLKKLVDWLPDHQVEKVLLNLSIGINMEVLISVGDFASIFIKF